ncbi:hypothetical protein BaRGS_00010495 [Batillaria attramentaria]|uniref:Uncharacterized protein n=1 Tax=Batillaria attramentaria TaxID=370345 RepID=A0ABD0LFV5_9CAEN
MMATLTDNITTTYSRPTTSPPLTAGRVKTMITPRCEGSRNYPRRGEGEGETATKETSPPVPAWHRLKAGSLRLMLICMQHFKGTSAPTAPAIVDLIAGSERTACVSANRFRPH